VEDDGTEEGLEFVRTVFGEPGGELILRLDAGRRGRARIGMGRRLRLAGFRVLRWLIQTLLRGQLTRQLATAAIAGI
jgi:hypothetical protein